MTNVTHLHSHAYLDKKGFTLAELQAACGSHAIYLQQSKIETSNGWYQDKFLFRTMINIYGEQSAERILPKRIEYIHAIGKLNDKFAYGKTAGAFTPIGFTLEQIVSLKQIIVCAGLADGFRLFQASGIPVACGVGELQINNICQDLLKVNPNLEIIAAGDNDYAGIKAVHTSGMPYILPIVEKDWSDIYQNEGPVKLKKQINNVYPALALFPDRHYAHKLQRQILKHELSKNINKLERCAGLEETATMAYSILEKYEFRMPFEFDLGELTKQITLACKHTLNAVNVQDLSSIIHTRISKRKRKSLTLTHFDSKAVKKKHYLHELPGLPHFTPRDFTGVLAVRAWKSIGKTQLIGQPFLESKQNQGLALGLCHRISLTFESASRLKLDHYQDKFLNVDETLGLAACLPSITKKKHANFYENLDYVFIDEIAQGLNFLESNQCSTSDGTNADVYEKLKTIVAKAKCVVVVDAELNDRVINFLEVCRPGEKFHVYDINEKPQTIRKAGADFQRANKYDFRKKDVNYIVGDKALSRGYGDMLARLKEKQNLWIALESSKRAAALGKFLKQQMPDDFKCLVINADTKNEPEQIRFLNDADNVSKEYQVIIHSPVISSGLSVEHKNQPEHFDHGYFIGGGFTITPSDASQMLARVRYLSTSTLLLISNNKKPDVKDARAILIGKEQASILDGNHLDFTEFDRFCALIKQDEAAAKADFINGLLWLLEEEGHNVTALDKPFEDLEKEIKAARDEAKDEYKTNILNASDIDSSYAFELSKKSSKTWQETCEYQKYLIKHSLNREVLTDYDFENWDDGRVMSKMRRYAACYQETAFEEKADIEHLSHRKFSKARVYAYQYIFDGIDIEGNERITQQQAQTIIKRVIKKRYMLAELGVVPGKFGKYYELTSQGSDPFPFPKAPMKDVQGIFRLMGLELLRKDNYHKEENQNDYAVNLELVQDIEELCNEIDFSRLGGYLLKDKAGNAEIELEHWQIISNLVVSLIEHANQPYLARTMLNKECEKLGIERTKPEVKALYDKIRVAGG